MGKVCLHMLVIVLFLQAGAQIIWRRLELLLPNFPWQSGETKSKRNDNIGFVLYFKS